MPSADEVEVMRLLTSVDIDPVAVAARIEARGTAAVTVLCEAALGSYPGLRPKVRTNAVALLGWVTHPQAGEAVSMLVLDPSADVAIRALRGIRRQTNAAAIDNVASLLTRPDTPEVIAAEAVRALGSFEVGRATDALDTYSHANPDVLPHRGAPVVRAALEERGMPAH